MGKTADFAFVVDADSGANKTARAPADAKLNWKGKLREKALAMRAVAYAKLGLADRRLVQGLLSAVMFPDDRAEWVPWAKRALDGLLRDHPPDVVITSHEPANSIPVGLRASRKGFAWVADLGDPVLAPYTPARWRKKAYRTEAAICQSALLVTVTSEQARKTLLDRHPAAAGKVMVLTQGFDPRGEADLPFPDSWLDESKLEVLYTGSFYSFRSPGELIEAVLTSDAVRLNVASIQVPQELAMAAAKRPDKFRLLGFVPHRMARLLQRRCDVLINISNDDPIQVPGKLYEYLGSGTPVLHIAKQDKDAASELVERVSGGWVAADNHKEITAFFQQALLLKRNGVLGQSRKIHPELNQFSWPELGRKLVNSIEK
jgi:glycosyltransferase involved in cell wall biosynthesis